MSMLLAALLISANPAVAQQPAAAAPVRVQPAKPAKEKKVCKADPTETGSHMVQRICMTQEEWDHRGRNVDEFNSTIGGVSH